MTTSDRSSARCRVCPGCVIPIADQTAGRPAIPHVGHMAPARVALTVAASRTTDRNPMLVHRAYIPDDMRPADYRAWPYSIPAVAELSEHGLEFTQPVTFL